MLYSGLYTQITQAASIVSLLAPPNNSQPIIDAVFFGAAAKEPPKRFVILNVVDQEPAGQTHDGKSALMDGEIQFDSYAESQLASRQLSRAVRFLLQDFGGPLSDGTTIQFTEVTMDRDAGYSVGAQGYIFRSLLRIKAMYTEAA